MMLPGGAGPTPDADAVHPTADLVDKYPDWIQGANQARWQVAEIAEKDAAYLLVWKIETLAGRELTAVEVGYWTEIARMAAGLPSIDDRILPDVPLDNPDDANGQ